MNAFEAQKKVNTGFVQLTKPSGEVFRFVILNHRVEALTLNDTPLEDGDERGPSFEDLNDSRWEVYHACNLNSKRGIPPVWFTGFRLS